MKKVKAEMVWKSGLFFFLVIVVCVAGLGIWGLEGKIPVEYGLLLIFSFSVFLSAWLIRDFNEEPGFEDESPESPKEKAAQLPLVLGLLAALGALCILIALIRDFLVAY